MRHFVILPLLMLGACASIVDGKSQNITINTTPKIGARCELKNESGTWYVEIPGSVTIQRDKGDLFIKCSKSDLTGTAEVVSYTKSMAFGNILFGGPIGVIVDRENGSAFEYPQSVTIPMSKAGERIRIEPPVPPADQKQYPE